MKTLEAARAWRADRRGMANLGPVPLGATMGHRPRGLFRIRHGLGFLPARPCPLPGLPLGRGRTARHLRRPAAALLRASRSGTAVDPILKERLFGLTGSEGNHGEDVKEYYYYLDATPTTPICKGLYKYPQRAFPYGELRRREPAARSRTSRNTSCIDTGVFAEDRYFDVEVEYAKVSPGRHPDPDLGHEPGPGAGAARICCRPLVPQHLVLGPRRPPTRAPRPCNGRVQNRVAAALVQATHPTLGEYLAVLRGRPRPAVHGERNQRRAALGRARTGRPTSRTASTTRSSHGGAEAVNPDGVGTKVAAHYRLEIAPGATEIDPAAAFVRATCRSRSPTPTRSSPTRIAEADAFYAALAEGRLTEDEARVQRQALAGLIWTKQYYNYDVAQWLDGDPAGPPPPEARRHGRNSQWRHHNSGDVISMPDKWEYPWYAAWDLAFHCIAFGLVDPSFAKDQLLLCCDASGTCIRTASSRPTSGRSATSIRPSTSLAARALYLDEQRTDRRRRPRLPGPHLPQAAAQLHLVGQPQGCRAARTSSRAASSGWTTSASSTAAWLPPGLSLEQADGTAWMATYCLNMAWAALELAEEDPAYEDLAIKFLEHYMAIGGAMNGLGGEGSRPVGRGGRVLLRLRPPRRTASGCR